MGAPRPLEAGEIFELPQRSIRALEETDAMSPELRECVHEFGYAIVRALISHGIKEPRAIRQLVHEIWMGARQPAQRNRIGRKYSPVMETLDWVLLQAGSQIGAVTLLRVLWANSMVIVPYEPSSIMVDASLAELRDFDVKCTKTEKHRRRLRAAIRAQAQRLWPQLFSN
jgi:hypothetical protein